MRSILTISAALCLVMVGATTASAAAVEAGCGCTEDPETCDFDKTLELSRVEINGQGSNVGDGNRMEVAQGTYIIDQDGRVWYCEEDDCSFTGLYV